MRNLRHVNIDHLHVGWYQSTQYGTFLNKALLDSQFNYQHSIEESVVLIYGKYHLFYFNHAAWMQHMYERFILYRHLWQTSRSTQTPLLRHNLPSFRRVQFGSCDVSRLLCAV